MFTVKRSMPAHSRTATSRTLARFPGLQMRASPAIIIAQSCYLIRPFSHAPQHICKLFRRTLYGNFAIKDAEWLSTLTVLSSLSTQLQEPRYFPLYVSSITMSTSCLERRKTRRSPLGRCTNSCLSTNEASDYRSCYRRRQCSLQSNAPSAS